MRDERRREDRRAQRTAASQKSPSPLQVLQPPSKACFVRGESGGREGGRGRLKMMATTRRKGRERASESSKRYIVVGWELCGLEHRIIWRREDRKKKK